MHVLWWMYEYTHIFTTRLVLAGNYLIIYLLNVVSSLLGAPVVVVVQPLLNRVKVHGLLDYLKVVWEPKLNRVNWLAKWPGHLMLDNCLDDSVFDEEELVGLSAGTGGRRHHWRLNNPIHRCQGGLVPEKEKSKIKSMNC